MKQIGSVNLKPVFCNGRAVNLIKKPGGVVMKFCTEHRHCLICDGEKKDCTCEKFVDRPEYFHAIAKLKAEPFKEKSPAQVDPLTKAFSDAFRNGSVSLLKMDM